MKTGNYYYGARYYDPKWSIFISVDPLAEQTMDAYGYCYQNPVNLTDPRGMSAEGASPIFDFLGNYLGNDSEGFKGEVIFKDSGQFQLFGGGEWNPNGTENKNAIDHKTALALGSTLDEITADHMTQGEIDMVNNAINFIVSFTDGISNDRSKMHNGKTSASYHYIGKDAQGFQSMFMRRANDGTKPSNNQELNYPAWVSQNEPHTLTYNLSSSVWSSKGQFTVANIQNTYVHEWGAHVLADVPGVGRAHLRAYEMQTQHSSWKQTTPYYKSKLNGGRDEILKEKD